MRSKPRQFKVWLSLRSFLVLTDRISIGDFANLPGADFTSSQMGLTASNDE